jgi:hypothetical protein
MPKLIDEQRKKLAELDEEYKAKLAERETLIKEELAKAISEGNSESIAQLEKQMASDKKTLEAELEEKKEKVRQGQE